MKQLNWGVIGAGAIAINRTMPGILKASHARLYAIMNRNAEKAESLCKQFGAEKVYASAEALVSDPKVDCVYISSPVGLHLEQIKLAASHHKHILCEKPLGLDAKEAMEAVECCQKAGVVFSVGFMMRYSGRIQKMRELVQSGAIGTPVSIHGRFSGYVPYAEGSWMYDPKLSGGGPLMDMGIHLVDLIGYITGQQVTHVCAIQEQLTCPKERSTVEDSSSVLLRLSGGTQAVIQTNFNIPDPCAKWTLDIFGTQGRLMSDCVIHQLDGGILNTLLLSPSDEKEGLPKTGYGDGTNYECETKDLYETEIERFCLSVLEHRPTDYDPMDCVAVQQIIDAAFKSTKTGRIIRMA